LLRRPELSDPEQRNLSNLKCHPRSSFFMAFTS
jgi:hypothetical protein